MIEAAPGDRLLVDAGPGTGKTAVACARLGHLIANDELRASQTWMVSFTRTAVAEIRARLHGYVGDGAFAVKVATVDAHAWTIHSGYDPTASLTGSYDENIDRVFKLVTEDDDVLDYLQNVEHLVVDEAQDLVGRRADLIEAIIAGLSPDCGVTVFADEAQAIYGFSEEEPANEVEEGEALLERLRRRSDFAFRSVSLDTIHRTSAPGLRNIFSDVRAAVLGGGGAGIFGRIRNAVAANADSDALQRSDLGIETLPSGSLVLFRRRSEALEASQFCSTPHSLRLSGYGANLPPWIAAIFHDWMRPRMDLDAFGQRWQERLGGGCTPEYGPEEAWSRLIRLAGGSDDALDVNLLRQVLSRRAASAELAVPEFGLPGPVLGTIHASKGREADSVLLLMPIGEEFRSTAAEEEETRVLFVGSTRARASLHVGNATKWPGTSINSGRCYRTLSKKYKPAAMVEFGRPEDLGVEGLVGVSHQSASTTQYAQQWLAKRADVILQFDLVRDPRLEWNYRLTVAGDNVNIGLTSSRLQKDLWEVAKRVGDGSRGGLQPPPRISHVRGLGCRTVVVAPDDPVAERLHPPWSRSGFVIAPRIAAFTRVGFWRKR